MSILLIDPLTGTIQEAEMLQNRTTPRGSMDLLAAPQLLQTLRSVEWEDGDTNCPMCYTRFPTAHNLDCRLDKTIALLEKVIADGRLLWEEQTK